jgi:hypothetical protein
MDIQQAIQKVQSLNNQINANTATIMKQTIEMNFAVSNKEKNSVHSSHYGGCAPYRILSKGCALSFRISSRIFSFSKALSMSPCRPVVTTLCWAQGCWNSSHCLLRNCIFSVAFCTFG